MRIPENKIEEIRSAASIVDVISEHVHLRNRGKNYIGLCPFHNEKTPSFTVSEEKQIYHCFGCHAGGNVYKFLMEYLKISFIEAVQELAEKLGITLEFDEDNFTEKQSEQEILYDINSAAGRYFSDNLLNSTEGEFARTYFEGRKIKPKTMREFGLGYSLPGRDNFIEFAQSKKIDLEKALYLGLIGKNNNGRLFDKFSGRIIFPIFSPNGRVIAFAGRILDKKEGTAKYLNSPESQIYFKGRILYGLSHAKDEIRRLDKAILVEGYMDLISLYQSGIKNVVAVSGTALTDDQAQLLSRYTKNVVLLFDADTAGIKASMRSIEILLKKDIEIKIVSLPSGEDPDSFVNNFGKEKFEDLVKQAQNFLEYQSAYYESQGMFEDPTKMAEAIRELVKPVAYIKDGLKRTLLLKSIAHKFNLRTNLIEEEFNKLKRDTNEEIERLKKELHQQTKYNESISYVTKEIEYVHNVEIELLRLIFENESVITSFIFDNISYEEFERKDLKVIAELAFNSFKDQGIVNVDFVVNNLPDQKAKEDFFKIIIDRNYISHRWENSHPGAPREEILQKLTIDTVCNFRDHKITEETEKILIDIAKVQDEWYLTEDEPRLIELMRTKDNLNISKLSLKELIANNFYKNFRQN